MNKCRLSPWGCCHPTIQTRKNVEKQTIFNILFVQLLINHVTVQSSIHTKMYLTKNICRKKYIQFFSSLFPWKNNLERKSIEGASSLLKNKAVTKLINKQVLIIKNTMERKSIKDDIHHHHISLFKQALLQLNENQCQPNRSCCQGERK